MSGPSALFSLSYQAILPLEDLSVDPSPLEPILPSASPERPIPSASKREFNKRLNAKVNKVAKGHQSSLDFMPPLTLPPPALSASKRVATGKEFSAKVRKGAIEEIGRVVKIHDRKK